VTELRLAKKQQVKKNQGGGAGPLLLKRRYAREKIEVKSKHKEAIEMNPNEPRLLRLAEMDRDLDALKRDSADRRRERAEERNARVASEVDERANRIMQAEGMDYGTAIRRAVAESDHFAPPDEPAQSSEAMADAVARRMKATPEYYPDPDETDEGDEPVGSTHQMSDADYQRQLKEAAKARGYDI